MCCSERARGMVPGMICFCQTVTATSQGPSALLLVQPLSYRRGVSFWADIITRLVVEQAFVSLDKTQRPVRAATCLRRQTNVGTRIELKKTNIRFPPVNVAVSLCSEVIDTRSDEIFPAFGIGGPPFGFSCPSPPADLRSDSGTVAANGTLASRGKRKDAPRNI